MSTEPQCNDAGTTSPELRINSTMTSKLEGSKRVNECAIKIAKSVNYTSSHLTDFEAYELCLELEARLRKARIQLGKQLFKGKKT